MARHSRLAVLDALYAQGMLPIFYHAELETCKTVTEACAEGGSTLIEFTNRGDRAFLRFTELEEYCAQSLPHMILGAGSIIDSETAAFYINAGANFIVGPNFEPEIAKLCNKRKVAYIPGCASVSEIVTAYEAGVEFVKIFPAQEVGGPSFIRALKGPLPQVSIVATGGVEINDSLKGWFDAGVSVVGLGASLFPAAALKSRDRAAIATLVKKAIEAVLGAKSKSPIK